MGITWSRRCAGLYGDALKTYKKALSVEPGCTAAVEGIGEVKRLIEEQKQRFRDFHGQDMPTAEHDGGSGPLNERQHSA